MTAPDTRNPCIKICRFDAEGKCLGCLRTRAEVKGWKRLPDAAKAAVNERLRTHGGPGGGRKAGKRLKTLDRKIRKLEAKLARLRLERAGMAPPMMASAPPD